MLQFLLDTDHLTLYEHQHPTLLRRLAQCAPGEVGISAVTVEEALRGRLAQVARARDGADRITQYALLVKTVHLFRQFPIVPFDQAAENHFQPLKSLRVRAGPRDRKIAAVALANQLILLTRNRRDFVGIPRLLLDDWS